MKVTKQRRITVQESISWDRIFQEFLTEQHNRGNSPVTIDGYSDNFRLFLKYFKRDPSETNRQTFSDYIGFTLQRYNNNRASANTHLRHVSVIMRYGMKNDLLTRFDIDLPRVPKKVKPILHLEELKKLIAEPLRKEQFSEWRTWAMVCVLAETGARRTSLLNVKVKDVDFYNHRIKFGHTKNGDELELPIDEELERRLKKYLTKWEPKPDMYLFPNQFGEQLNVSYSSGMLNAYAAKRGVNARGFHCYRRMVATTQARCGATAPQISKQLGHKGGEMAFRYIQLASDDLVTLLPNSPLAQAAKVNRRIKAKY